MATYTDPKGKDWPVEFSDDAIVKIADLLGFDVTEDRTSLDDPGVLLRAAQILCRDEITACQMPTRQFAKRTVQADPTAVREAIEQAADDWQTEPEIEQTLFEKYPITED